MGVQGHCFQCHEILSFPDRVGLREECNSCGSDVHCCKNCLHYDPKFYNSCKESQAEKVAEKERANRCDHFALLDRGSGAGALASHQAQKEKLKAQAEALFKNLKPPSSQGDEGSSKN